MNFKNIARRIATAGIAAAMVVGMSMTAFATEDPVTVTKNSEKYVISKTLKTPANGVDKPTENYTFSIAAGTPGAGETAGVLPETTTYTIQASDLSGSDGTYTGVTSSDIFSGVTYTAEGIYVYTITETAGSTDGMTYSGTSYTVKVRVVKDADGNFDISGITANDGTGKKDAIAFTNTYDPDSTLTISKTATGSEFANSSDEFEFSITFTADTNVNAAGAQKAVTMTSTTDTNNTANPTITYGEAYTFKLAKDKNIVFNVPAGTKYAVTETDKKGATSTTVTKNSSSITEGSDQYVGVAGDTVVFTNTHDVSPLTGIVNNYGAWIALIAIVAAAAVMMIIRRRHQDA